MKTSIAALFPGQGSQHPGMGQFLYDNFKEARVRFEEAGDILRLDFKKLCFSGTVEELQLTENTQPSLLLVSVATFDVVHALSGFRPCAAAGHSIGEYAALVTAGALSFQQALPAVRTRGQAMQAAVPIGEGAMCAVMGPSDDQVRTLCAWVEKESGLAPLSPANFNSPGQVVVSGRASAVAWLQANFKKEMFGDSVRVRFIPLKVSAPFHCAMMKPAEDKMREVLTAATFNDIDYPIVQNYIAKEIRTAPELRENLIRQVSAPVLWTQCMQQLQRAGATQFVEFGAGRVLAGLAKKIDSERMPTLNLTSLDELKEAVRILQS